jgi:hypothetical protein
MTHWEVVGWCFALTVGSLAFDFWHAGRFESALRRRLLLATGADAQSGKPS